MITELQSNIEIYVYLVFNHPNWMSMRKNSNMTVGDSPCLFLYFFNHSLWEGRDTAKEAEQYQDYNRRSCLDKSPEMQS